MAVPPIDTPTSHVQLSAAPKNNELPCMSLCPKWQHRGATHIQPWFPMRVDRLPYSHLTMHEGSCGMLVTPKTAPPVHACCHLASVPSS